MKSICCYDGTDHTYSSRSRSDELLGIPFIRIPVSFEISKNFSTETVILRFVAYSPLR